MMIPGDILGFGTQVVIDGFELHATHLDEPSLCDFVEGVASRLEQHAKLDLHTAAHDEGVARGLSVGARLNESHVIIHAFPACATLSLVVFSRKYLDWQALARELSSRFEVGRLESYVANRSRMLPKQDISKALLGNRHYTAFRLDCITQV
jgi:S-adenosylmethionine/arginine decarboxylase-like enzyme